MNPFKKINTHLLENYPLMWHSKVLQLSIAAVVMWILSFVVGYSNTTIEVLQKYEILTYYFEGYFVLFHAIYCLIIICLWAFSFYRHNAFKSFYPLKKNYFIQLFFHLFIPFVFLLSAYYPYTIGMKTKMHTYYNENELKKDLDVLNKAFPFLVTYSSDYNFENRVYPNPYPLKVINYDENNNDWRNTPNAYIRNPEKDGEKYIRYYPEDHEKNTVKVSGKKLQVYSSVQKRKYPEDTQEIIVKFYKESELDHPSYNSILNFSSVLVDPNVDEYAKSFSWKEDDFLRFFLYFGEDQSENYKQKYAAETYSLIKRKEYGKMQQRIDDFESVCAKYEIATLINSQHLIRYLKYKNFKNFDHDIIATSDHHYGKQFIQNEVNKLQSLLNHKKDFIASMTYQHCYFYDSGSLRNIISNFKRDKTSVLANYSLVSHLFLAFILIWIFLSFEFFTIRNFVITIPIMAVVFLLNVFAYLGYLNIDPSSRSEAFLLTSHLITFTFIIGLTWLGLKNKRIKRSLLTVFVNLCYWIFPVYLITLVLAYHSVFISLRSDAGALVIRDIIINPYLFFFFALVGLLAFFGILRKWKAYAE